MDNVHYRLKKHLKEIEGQVLEGLGQLQEICGTLHSCISPDSHPDSQEAQSEEKQGGT